MARTVSQPLDTLRSGAYTRLVLQGEVEQISLMKPKAEDEHDSGLLEYLEDIIGTKHYVEHITKAQGQLEDLSEERRRNLQLVKVARTNIPHTPMVFVHTSALSDMRRNTTPFICASACICVVLYHTCRESARLL